MIYRKPTNWKMERKSPNWGLAHGALTMTKRRRQSAPLLRWGIVSLILHRPTKMSRALARESVAAAFPVRSCLSQARWPQN